jgi:hypothetical protein
MAATTKVAATTTTTITRSSSIQLPAEPVFVRNLRAGKGFRHRRRAPGARNLLHRPLLR